MTPQQQPVSDEEFAALLTQPCPGVENPGIGTSKAVFDDAAVRDLRDALRSYRRETLHWSERRSAGKPSLAAPARQQARWAAPPRWSLALVAVVTIAGGAAHLAGNREAADQPVTVLSASASSENQPSNAADIEADNLLLSSIDAELSYHAVSPVDPLHLQKKQSESSASVRPEVTD